MCALNVLTKGLIGLVFPAGAIGLYLLLTGNLRHLLKLRLLSSALVFLAIAAPWHILAALRNPAQGHVRGFLWFYFVNEHFLRFLNKRVPRDYDTVPLLLFWALLVLWLIPWTVFLPQSLQEVPRRWREFRAQMTRRQRAYLLVFLVERGDRGLLQPLDAAGILHDPGDSGDGVAGGRMAATGESIRRG